MKRKSASILVAVGVMSTALGLLFLAASQGQERRLVVAVVGTGLGAVLTGLGVWAFKRLDRVLPEHVRGEPLALARREGSEPDREPKPPSPSAQS